MNAAELSSLLPLAVVAPILGAVAAPVLARWSGRLALAASLLALAVSSVVLVVTAPTVLGGHVLVEHVGGWRPVAGHQLGVTFAADALGLVFALLCAVVGGLLLLFTFSELADLGRHELGGYACLFQLLLAALIASALTADLLNLFVWFEVAALASYGLTGFFLERPIAVEAAFKIMVLTNMAAFYVFVAIALLYAGHGALNLGELRAAMPHAIRSADLVALALVVAGFGTKAGLVPFHGWLADAHSAAPGPVSALFSGLMVNLGLLGLLRVVFAVYDARPHAVLVLLGVLGALAALGGAALALVQDDLKRLLAYDTVSQMGVLVMALAVASDESLAGLVYHLVDHALFKTLLFLCAGAIVHATGMTRLSEMGGLARHRRMLTIAFVVGVLAIAGVPPLNGYVSLGLIHASTEHGHLPFLVALTVAQVLTVAALARATYLAFFRRRDDDYDRFERPRAGMVVSFLMLSVGCIAFGVAPTWVLDHLVGPATASLTDSGTYAAATLAGHGHLPAVQVPFTYLDPVRLLVSGGTVAVGVLVAWWVVRHERRTASGLRPLVALHTGSVNDYAAFAVLGLVVSVLVLTAAG
jgi:multicomponent Na+:H+ antiporter subunit D